MEQVSGINLRAHIKSTKQKRLSEKEARILFKQILNALVYCHGLNITHRDIKLENILLTPEGVVKIIDFGFSTSFPSTQKVKLFCGTPSYMAPEIVAKREYSGPPADVWALGVLLYAMLTGSFPFKGILLTGNFSIGSTDKELYKSIMQGKCSIPEYLSAEGKEILSSIFTVNPDCRPTALKLLDLPWMRDEDKPLKVQQSASGFHTHCSYLSYAQQHLRVASPNEKKLNEQPDIIKAGGHTRTLSRKGPCGLNEEVIQCLVLNCDVMF